MISVLAFKLIMITISIIIPTLNRADTLKATLTSILIQNDLNGVEVIVIDNGSTDNTLEVYNEFAESKKLSSYYQNDPEPGLLTGRHLGASLAKGSILCFLDDDVELAETWLQGVRNSFTDEEVQISTGPCIPKYLSAPPEWLKYFWTNTESGKYCDWLSLIDLGDKKFFTHPNYALGLNFCIRKDALISLGGFHPDCMPSTLQMYQGDGETGLTLKAYRQNYKCLYHPEIKLFHFVASQRLTIEYFKKRAFFQGVCNSFSELKEQSSLVQRKVRYRAIIKIIVSRIKITFTPNKKNDVPSEIRELKALFKREEKKGFNFHQQAYQRNEIVRNWVHKKDYWDYKLPV